MEKIFVTRMIALLTMLIIVGSCSDDDSGDVTPSGNSNQLMLTDNDNLGQVITDGTGQVLYFFTMDAGGSSACTDDCLASWPPYYAENPEIGEGLDQADFGSITRGDGEMQSTYKGWPLYYYSPTADGVLGAPGAASGEGVNNLWYVAKESYDLMIADAQLVGEDGVNYTSNYTEGEGITKYFTDAEGRTLYLFINDARNTNNYTNEDFSNNDMWPVFHIDIDNLPSFMNPDDFGEITLEGDNGEPPTDDGDDNPPMDDPPTYDPDTGYRMGAVEQEPQLTYRGWPLYYYGGDTQRGDTKGVSVPMPGIWRVINDETPAAQ